MKPLVTVGKIALWALLLFGCGGAGQVEQTGTFNNDLAGAPGWVLAGCDGYAGAPSGAFCGVGSIGATSNISLARSSAQARGRTDIARQLETRVQAMVEDYAATVSDFNQIADEQSVVDVARQVTEATVSGARQVDTWVSPDGGTLFVLMLLDYEGFVQNLDGADQLSERVQAAIRERASEAFGRLDEAIAE